MADADSVELPLPRSCLASAGMLLVASGTETQDETEGTARCNARMEYTRKVRPDSTTSRPVICIPPAYGVREIKERATATLRHRHTFRSVNHRHSCSFLLSFFDIEYSYCECLLVPPSRLLLLSINLPHFSSFISHYLFIFPFEMDPLVRDLHSILCASTVVWQPAAYFVPASSSCTVSTLLMAHSPAAPRIKSPLVIRACPFGRQMDESLCSFLDLVSRIVRGLPGPRVTVGLEAYSFVEAISSQNILNT